MTQFELTPPVFSILSSLIEEKSGLHYGLLDRELLQDRAAMRALEAGFDTLLDYYYFLRYDPGGEQELEKLVESLVVNETYFFREWPGIQVIVDSVIEPRCAKGQKVRVWSAACATGEEPLSLAMLLDHRNLLDRVQIVASDISAKALCVAHQGRFGRRSVRQIPDTVLFDKYIEVKSGGYEVPLRLIESIRWERRNLLTSDLSDLGTFDVILCRNVLIYFGDRTVISVLGRFCDLLTNDGRLLVGVSESLLRYGGRFIGEEGAGVFVYRKAPHYDC
ncbi:MAG: protein-glutamate O-methyltransferase CheR [Bdellovibrionales bacterium]